MFKLLSLSLILFSFISCSSYKKNPNQCSRLSECLEIASKLTGKTYISDGADLNTQIEIIGPYEWDRATADSIIGELLSSSGYPRIKSTKDNTYYLINARDVRYDNRIQSYSANKTNNDPLPPANSADYAELIYTTKNGFVRPSEIARNLRPFMSRYGRVIDNPASGTIIIRDHMTSIHRFLKLIREMDVPVTKAENERTDRMYRIEELREKTRQEWLKSLEEFRRKKE